jgi:cadmium resistance transport/sequestration family protein
LSLPYAAVPVGHLPGTFALAGAAFTGTNIDDLIVLTVLFLSARAAGRPPLWQIWVGQYVGIAVLVAASALAAVGLTVVPDAWVGLLGLVPFGLGVRGLAAAIRHRTDDQPPALSVTTGVVSVAGVTIANGGDNVSVYAPMFRTVGMNEGLFTVAVFAALVTVWCLAASWLGSHRNIVAAVGRYGHWAVPVVFMAIGAVIMAESGVIGRLI